MSNVIIVDFDEIDLNSTQVSVSIGNFIEIVNTIGSEIVLFGQISYDNEDSYLVYYNGGIIKTNFIKCNSWEDFKTQYNLMVNGKFNDYNKYQDAVEYGINDYQEYDAFISSSAYYDQQRYFSEPDKKKILYQIYLDFNKSGFEEFDDYRIARNLGIKTPDEYHEFAQSEWAESDYYSRPVLTKENYTEYMDAKEKGFSNKNDYRNADRLGFVNSKIYQWFLDSELDSKEEFDYLFNQFPNEVDTQLESIIKIKEEANHDFKRQRYKESVQKDFLVVEKLLKLTFTILNKRKTPVKINFDQILRKVNSEYALGMVKLGTFSKCRKMRNDIAHENRKITESEARDVKEFLEGINLVLTPFVIKKVETEFRK